jgi:hypothetical protein
MALLDTPRPSRLALFATIVALAAAPVGCRGQEEGFAASLDRDDVVPAATVGSTTIYVHRNMDAVAGLKPQLLETVRLGLDSIGRYVPVRDLEVRIMVFPDPVLPMYGLSGVASTTRIDIFLDPEHPNLQQGIREALIPTLAHEYHHALRERALAYGATLFDAMITEGLAEQFVTEVTGRRPPWAGPRPPEWLAHWRDRAAEVWCGRDYDHAAWFVGTTDAIPRGTGFEVGSSIVGEYLEAHPDAAPSTLYATPGRVFMPADLRDDPVADCWWDGALSTASI